jgi:glycosyltransferase involved in cell wall biosynthesis
VPPILYGGHERLVSLFAEEYVRLGYDVTLLAGPQSKCSGKTVVYGVNNLKRSGIQRMKEIIFVWYYLFKNGNNFDLVHNFGRLIYLIPILHLKVKKIMTYGRQVSHKGIFLVNKLPNRNLIFTACSNYCVSTGNVAGHWQTVYNAIDFKIYMVNEHPEPDAPLMFLGRLDRIKGVHTAIEVAKATGNSLLIGGNISHTDDNYIYFKQEIEPQIDNMQIKYIGALTDEQKNCYLRQSKALLFPIEWDEPFGIVMIEAMACGTPVIAFDRGAVNEVIDEGITGIVVKSIVEMKSAIKDVTLIDRRRCSETAAERFDVKKIAMNYLNL